LLLKLLFICSNWALIGDDEDDFTHSMAVSIITGLRVEYRCKENFLFDLIHPNEQINKTKAKHTLYDYAYNY
jgi:hypothetical protein